ncbi:hypothetical protein [Streptomyces sp. NPDC001530]|uniref:hypothetical protein n=1 Tax=Streptomyces sp. NPDC001530 TaxID=3364582 RepID=UPI0036A4CB45
MPSCSDPCPGRRDGSWTNSDWGNANWDDSYGYIDPCDDPGWTASGSGTWSFSVSGSFSWNLTGSS